MIAADYDDHGQLLASGSVATIPPDPLRLRVDEIERQLASLKSHLAAFPEPH